MDCSCAYGASSSYDAGYGYEAAYDAAPVYESAPAVGYDAGYGYEAAPVAQAVSYDAGYAAAAPAPVYQAQETALPALPAVNSSCYSQQAVGQGRNSYQQVDLGTEYRTVNLYDNDVQTVVRENNNYTTFNKTVVTTVNRNHNHTLRVVNNENQYNTYVTNNVVRVNDIHRTNIENVQGESRVFNDYKQTQQVEPARCMRAEDGQLVGCQ